MRSALSLTTLLFCQLAMGQNIAIYPSPGTVEKGTTKQFSSYVAISPNTITWSVNGVTGGSATYGTVSQSGLYTAPAVTPPNNVVTVRATSAPKPAVFGDSLLTITQPTPWLWSAYPSMPWMTTYVNATTLKTTGDLPTAGSLTTQPVNIKVTVAPLAPVTVIVSPNAVSSAQSAATQFTAAVNGSSNMAVTLAVTSGAISATGLYVAPATMPANAVVTISATSVADNTKFGQASVTLQAAGGGGTPGNNGADLTAGRFLEQAAVGPTPAELNSVQTKGINTWLNDQFALPETVITIPPQSGAIQASTFNRLATAPDQLRQKMAWALGQIIVISMNKNIYPNEYVPYQQILSRNAFGNYRTLLGEIAMSPQMGKYLDIANSNKPGLSGGANENFPRELMQLFSIGLNKLNLDGSTQLANGQPIPTYTQADVRQIALALTGWTYPTAPGAQPRSNNWEEFSQPKMETREANHDTSAKTLINGCTLPAGQTVQQDMDGVLDCVFNHPNIGPFIATRLIRSMVTSNPSPAFIQRIATVFNNNGAGVRGDLKAVLKAILTDAEARLDTVTPNSGRLKDPIYFIVSFVRMMNGTIVPAKLIPWNFVAMGQQANTPPSVFSYYSPLYRLPLNPVLFGPEFQIFTPTESVVEANMLHQMITSPNGDPSIDLSPFVAVAADTAKLLDLVDQKLFYGRMPAQIRTSLATAIAASYDNTQRVQTALYLAALSGQYQTQF